MVVSFKVSPKTKSDLIEYFKDKKRNKTPDYAVFQADEADTVVTLYTSGKVVFQGTSADIDGKLWQEIEKKHNPLFQIDEKKEKKKEKKDDFFDSSIYSATAIGSDEVGTGDYFGPLVVTACYVNKKDVNELIDLGVKDSKKLTDFKILEIVPKFLNKVSYKTFVLTNKEYNNKYNEDMNMNKIKAILHNKVLLDLKNKHSDYEYIVVDEFAKKDKYFAYLKEVPNKVENITFLTKGEEKSIAVACASLISRYIFLQELDKLGEKFDVFLPKGAGNSVDAVGASIVNKLGIDILKDIAKLNFKNTEKIKKMITD